MSPDRIIVTVIGIALILFIIWFFWMKKDKGTLWKFLKMPRNMP